MECTVCGEREIVYKTSGECRRCYGRRYHREKLAANLPPVIDRHNTISYEYAHRKVKRYRGKASEHACARCSVVAEEWSYTPGSPYEQTGTLVKRTRKGTLIEFPVLWANDIWAYEPLCLSCHRRKDGRDA